jgi:hypothetical protein
MNSGAAMGLLVHAPGSVHSKRQVEQATGSDIGDETAHVTAGPDPAHRLS